MTHPGDALSALLDGQLGADDAAAVRTHVESCAECARELEGVREARRLLRELPAVEPPAGWLDALLTDGLPEVEDADEVASVVPLASRRRNRSLVMLGAGGAVAAALVLVAVVALRDERGPSVAPQVAASIKAHESTVHALEDSGMIPETPTRFDTGSDVPPTTAEIRQTSQIASAFDVPQEIADYDLVEAYVVDGGVHLVYHHGPYALSIFERRGEPDWDSLPEDGTRLRIEGLDAWRWDDVTADGRVYVIDDHDLVVTVVSDEPGDAALDVIAALAGR
jgi:anti-sigma factor RsiW